MRSSRCAARTLTIWREPKGRPATWATTTRGMLERDLGVAAFDPARDAFAVRLQDQETPIGLVDVLAEHPSDGHPWIGVVEIHASHQRHGHGREVVTGILEWACSELSAAVVRASVDEDHAVGRRFAEAIGFREIDRRDRHGPAGQVPVIVYEQACR